MVITVGVLALQGGFSEHLSSLRKAAARRRAELDFSFVEVRTPEQLSDCDALVIPGGESTTLSLVAAQSGLLQPLREFVKVSKKPTWGTCAGLIFLSEAASSTKRGGQELIGGLDVRVHRNHFGRQRESFVTDLELPFLTSAPSTNAPFPAVFIRAPVVDALLTTDDSVIHQDEHVVEDGLKPPAPASGEQATRQNRSKIEVLATLPGRHASHKAALVGDDEQQQQPVSPKGDGDIVALRQGNVFGTSFHPELTDDTRIHEWWLHQVVLESSCRQQQ
ncbi:Senecionine N-oxygenase [Diatrype stigma]|uniref:glutaminase n=1 Tax=Diatrype stigma TaxID=117547 RepID=A0AAN9UJ18_9PEZI